MKLHTIATLALLAAGAPAAAQPPPHPVRRGAQMTCTVAVDGHGRRTMTIGEPHGAPIAAGTVIDWLLSDDPKMAPPGVPLSQIKPHALAGRGRITLTKQIRGGETAVTQVPPGPIGSCAAFKEITGKPA